MAPLMRIVAPGLILAVALQSTSALAQNNGRPPLPALEHRTAHYLTVKVWEGGSDAPNVNVRVPTALVSTVVALASWSGILDRSIEAAREHGCRHAGGVRVNLTGRQIASLWSDIVSGGPADLVRVEDGADRVVIRLE